MGGRPRESGRLTWITRNRPLLHLRLLPHKQADWWKRKMSPTSRAQVRAVIEPTPGTALRRRSRSASSGSRSSEVSRAVFILIERSMCSQHSLSSERMLSLTSSLVDISSAKYPSGAAAACPSSLRSASIALLDRLGWEVADWFYETSWRGRHACDGDSKGSFRDRIASMTRTARHNEGRF